MTDQETLAAAKQAITAAGNAMLRSTKRGHRRGLVKEENLAHYLSTFAEHAYTEFAYRLGGSEEGALALLHAVADAEKAEQASKEGDEGSPPILKPRSGRVSTTAEVSA